MTAPSVFGWAADRSGCWWYRIHQPLRALTAHGWTTRDSGTMPANPMDWDIIVGQRVCLPNPTTRWQELARDGHKGLVFEMDDDLFNVDPSNEMAFGFFGGPRIRANLLANIQVSAAVTVSTPLLAEVVRQHTDAPVYVLGNYIPRTLLDLPTPESRRWLLDADLTLTVGWAGSNTHAMDWAYAGGQVKRWLRKHPAVKFHTIGADYLTSPKMADEAYNAQIRHTPWVDSIPEYYAALDFNVGLAPLRPHVFNQSKSWVKALEYAARGIPTVASDTGPYSGFVDHGRTGFLVRRDHDWSAFLNELTTDHTLRESMGLYARDLAGAHVMEDHAWRWDTVYRRVLGDHSGPDPATPAAPHRYTYSDQHHTLTPHTEMETAHA